MAICFPSSAPRGGGGIPFGIDCLLNLFPVFRISKAGLILFLEFIKDGLADKRDEFTFDVSANQPMIL